MFLFAVVEQTLVVLLHIEHESLAAALFGHLRRHGEVVQHNGPHASSSNQSVVAGCDIHPKKAIREPLELGGLQVVDGMLEFVEVDTSGCPTFPM